MTICIIPARLNSSRFPGKLLAKAGGQTIIERTHACAESCTAIDDLFVATDSVEIASEVRSFGGKVIWTSSQCQNGTERIIDALQNEPELQKASIIINLQGDHPCTSPKTLERIASVLQENPEADASTAVRPIRSREDFLSPHVVKCVFDNQKYALYFSRSPIPFSKKESTKPHGFQHIGLYGYRTALLQKMGSMQDTDLQRSEDLEQLRLMELGYRIKIAEVDDEAIAIDTPEDLKKLEEWLACR